MPRTDIANFFETTLTAQMGPNDLTADVSTLGLLTSPCLIVIEPDSATQREVIRMDGTFGANQFACSSISDRYLEGSAAASNITHPVNSVVRCTPLKQHIDDLWDQVEQNDTDIGTNATDIATNASDLGVHEGNDIGGSVHGVSDMQALGITGDVAIQETGSVSMTNSYQVVKDITFTMPAGWTTALLIIKAQMIIWLAAGANYPYGKITLSAGTDDAERQLYPGDDGPVGFEYVNWCAHTVGVSASQTIALEMKEINATPTSEALQAMIEYIAIKTS